MRGDGCLAILLLLFISPFAAGDHFHYAALSWELVSGTTVKFTLVSAWSTDFQPFLDQADGNITVGKVLQVQGLDNPVLMYGDGDDSFVIVKATVVAVDDVLGMWRGEFTAEHTYATPGTYTASFSGCCRDFSVETLVDTAQMYSPRVAILPRQVIVTQSNSSFYMAAYDGGIHPSQQGMQGRFEWSLLTQGSAYTIDPSSGLVTAMERMEMAYLSVKVMDPDSMVYSTVEFEVQQLNLTVVEVPSMDLSYPPTRLPLDATNELVTSFPYTFSLRFTVPGPTPVGGPWNLVLTSSALPAGATLGPVSMAANMYNGTMGYESEFSWAPAADQEGWAVVCVQAYNRGPGVSPPIGSGQYCFDFIVLADSPPALEATLPPELEGGAEGVPVEWAMGQRLEIQLVATDRMAVAIDIAAVGALPAGATLSDRVEEQRSAEMAAMRTLSWEPDPKAGGSSGKLCFQAVDAGAASPELCFEYRVPKCMYKVRENEALVDIAMRFGTSWLQLWSLNKRLISRPEGYGMEGTIYAGLDLHVGQLVLVKEGDTLERIAARFGTTLRQIVNLNAEITPSRQLLTGQLLCLVPSSCSERA